MVPQAHTEVIGEVASSTGVLLFSCAVFVVVFCVVAGIWFAVSGRIGAIALVAAALASVLACMSVHIAQQWERVVVLRFGKLNRVSGPGLFWTIPVIEQNTMRVDGRTRVTAFGAEETLTSDLVPLNVNAVLFWMGLRCRGGLHGGRRLHPCGGASAQTALRDAIGRGTAAEVAIRRQQLDRELKAALEEKCSQWGIAVLSVEIRDILLPKELQDTMSLEAQAEQRKKARIILAEAEQDICDR